MPGAENGGGTANGVGRRLDIDSVEAGISAWEIDLFGRLRNLDRAAQEQYFASQSARDATQTALIAELARSEEHTSEIQSLMLISYAVFCLKKKRTKISLVLHRNKMRMNYSQKSAILTQSVVSKTITKQNVSY